ncbi:DNA polymerase III subunit delta' [Sneathiella sp.]|uniref:DNA polymerase III subunit delta' n=1 Tax=Sneathiella sp. TaxID=1964365 RepID=UPI00356A6D25
MSEVPVPDKLDKYPHPQDTRRLIGHETAEKIFLGNFNSGRFHHAWLITGAKGVGKATFAYRAAKFLLTQGAGEGGLFGPPDSLNVADGSPALAQIKAGAHPGLIVLKRQYDTKNKKLFTVIRVDDVRARAGFFRLTASEGSWRVVIVDPVDEMNSSAANAMLKILEEPPEKTVFLLLSHTPAGLLPTIRSRCRQLPLRPLSETDMRSVLEPFSRTLSPDQVDMLLAMADGSPGKALQLLDTGGLDIFAGLLDILKTYPRLDAEKLHGLADSVGRKDGEGAYRTICELYPWWLSRMVRAGSSNFTDGQFIHGESDIMKRLVVAHPLDAWVDLWEKGNRLIKKSDAVNLDRKQVVLNLFLAIERMGS